MIINYDLHWNPVRLIQRAGRVDRIGSDFPEVKLYNFFPEEGLDSLLGLVQRLADRTTQIDRSVGLDASVLGEPSRNGRWNNCGDCGRTILKC